MFVVSRPRRARRGVLLLVVLSMLVLFTLIGVTFVLVASRARITACRDARGEQYGDDYRKQLDEIFAQVVRDTTNPNSSARGHSMLNDEYGVDGVTATILSAISTANSGGQFIDLTIQSAPADLSDPTVVVSGNPLYYPNPTQTQLQNAGYFNGCVLTMTSGVASKLSTPSSAGHPPGQLRTSLASWHSMDWPPTRCPRHPMLSSSMAARSTEPALVSTPRRLTAAQLQSRTTLIDAADANNNPYALLPNAMFFKSPGTNYPVFGGIGGSDEDYDIADPQNMYLAYVPLTPPPSPALLHRSCRRFIAPTS